MTEARPRHSVTSRPLPDRRPRHPSPPQHVARPDRRPADPRAALPGPLDVDVAIVGGGFTGLWTAYYLAKADPKLRIAVLEKEVVGFGASGRNGGWISPFFPAPLETIAKNDGRDKALAMQRAMFDTVDEIGAVCAAEGIDARYHKGGVLNLATGTEQLARVRDDVEYYRGWGVGDDEIMWLDADAVRERIDVAGCLGAMYLTHCACLDPARVVRGLARVVEGLGVSIYEQTPVLAIESGTAVTAVGDVRAGVVVRGTEGFTPELPGARRDVIPTYSLMIATEPLPASSGTRSAGATTRRSPTAVTSTSTRCAPKTTASRSAAAARRTTSTPRCATNTSASTRCTRSSSACSRSSSRRRATRRSRTAGAAASASRATGSRRSATTRRAATRGEVATSATASPPRTWPARRSAT